MYRTALKLVLLFSTISFVALAGYAAFAGFSPLGAGASGAALAGAICSYLVLKPPVQPLPRDGAVAVPLPYSASPVAVVLQEDLPADRPVDERAYCSAWLSALAKEIGPCRPISTDESIPPSARLVVIPSGVCPAGALLEELTSFLESGGAVLLECPGKELSSVAGASPSKGRSAARRVLAERQEIDLWEEVQVEGYAPEGASVRWTDDEGRPVLLSHRTGSGLVWTLAFRYGWWRAVLTQGRVQEDGRLPEKGPDLSFQSLQTHDLQVDPGRSRKFVPVVDCLDAALFSAVREESTIPSLWYHPGAERAGCLLTFDEDYQGERCPELGPIPFPSSWFVVAASGFGPRARDYILSQSGSVALHWNRFRAHLTTKGFHLERRDLRGQIGTLESKLNEGVVANRTHYLLWDRVWDRQFQLMSAEGLRVDSSFGPGRGQHGYSFGTGFPYLPSSQEGRPVAIWELPFQIHEPMGGPTLDESVRLLKESIESYHTFVVALYHPYYCLPGGPSHERYRGLLEAMKSSYGLYATTIEQTIRHWEARLSAEIFTEYDGGQLHLRLSTREDVCLRIPRANEVSMVFVDGMQVPERTLLPLRSGAHQVAVIYQLNQENPV